jgi:hypothetical protein
MKSRMPIAGLLTVLGVALTAAAPGGSRSDMVVHEWGTFLAMNGSDGVSLEGMYHEEHALPAFVHARGRDQLRVRSAIIKGETPVIYFYAKRPERVGVRVGFPGGIWTQWYPQAGLVAPGLLSTAASSRPRNGLIAWDVDVLPAAAASPALPQTDADALWNFARDVDASYVRGADQTRTGSPAEWERFIFYRGLGAATLPIDVRVADGRVTITAGPADRLEHLYVLRVENGRAAYSYIPALEPGRTIAPAVPSMDTASTLDRFVAGVSDDVAARLTASGLFAKEARAMVNTWRSSYFRTDGIRVLFVLPQSWTDRFIPLEITPAPSAVVRVMVGRVEVLTADRERRAESAIRDLASADPAIRERAFGVLVREGRYVEPIVRRTLETTQDDRVRTLSRRLLLTPFITDLRASISDAATGQRLSSNPVYARAQLASLLREVGLAAEAKQEGELALSILERGPQPVMSDHSSRNLFRALARAHEGAGNDALALKWYGDFVRFGSQTRRCGGCHALEGPRDMSFFRDWWAGRKYAEYAQATGQMTSLIESHQRALDTNPGDVAAQLSLAYLHERRGDEARARALWTLLDPAGR